MKKTMLILILIFSFISCEQMKQPEPVFEKTKLISKKEQLGSRYDIFTKTQKIETKYYLIFENGKAEEVELGKYILAKEGTYYNVRK